MFFAIFAARAAGLRCPAPKNRPKNIFGTFFERVFLSFWGNFGVKMEVKMKENEKNMCRFGGSVSEGVFSDCRWSLVMRMT